ncbi:hypothetical protein HYFRA_00002208 [Hymenoscyphus fraxineus]|uniref:Fe2OG dioxygenase domain-containing protein n=1 Tax=Hymenoscyphus fraxineus TaxID=746836 RepID=A0A9N9KK17_9HELO|nr:hypothetical protein HYFRA_00002208 [Hymenoscyphus fraxineus]
MDLPTLDLSQFTHGNKNQRQQLASSLLSSLKEHGFVKLINHGVPEGLVSEMWKLSRAFFEMGQDQKAHIAHQPGPDPQRGWSHVGAESSSGLYRKGFLQTGETINLKDAREHWDQGPKTDTQYPNRWPEESSIPGFRQPMEQAFDALERVSSTIMEALEASLHLPAGTFLQKITREKNASELRMNHYPAIEVSEIRGGKVSRIWPHFDLGVITLLFQDSVGGLEFENRQQKGTFCRIQCGSTSEMVVNVSETLQRWTNDFLPAGLHRVSLPPLLENSEEGLIPERYSIAYFCKADRDASVGALEPFKCPNTKYRDITALEYQQQRLESAY